MIRADYIYEDKYASLGLAVMYRHPIALLPLEDRPRELPTLARLLPSAIPLSAVLDVLEGVPQ